MKNNQQAAYRFREVILNGTWVANTNFSYIRFYITFRKDVFQVIMEY